MREYLFRGKRKDNGEWVDGFLFHDYSTFLLRFLWKIQHMNKFGMPIGHYEVGPETVGQYTGLRDCKRTEEYPEGQRIFEGDIVHVLGNQQVEDWKRVDYIGLIAFLDAGFCVIDGTIDDHGFRRYGLCRLDFDLEVIGNIHDNPELLKEGGEE